MKQLVYDIKEMSDSKEIYGHRPSPIFAVFIYTILGLLVAALLYCGFGKIEMVATASGVIRPNEEVGTVSSLRGGQVTQVDYYDGQVVQKNDVLLMVDTTDLQLQLEGLQASQQDLTQKISMVNKFVEGIKAEKNPFSADASSEEYSYYIQFENYLLQIKNTQQTFDYDVNKTTSNINALNRQIEGIQLQIAGWKSYKASIEQGKNLAADYPEHEKMYLLYVANMDTLQSEYEAQKEQIEKSGTEEEKEKLLSDLDSSYKTTKEQERYKTIIQIDSTIQSLQAEISTAQANLKQNQIAKAFYDENTEQDGTPLSVSAGAIEQTAAMLNQRESAQAQLKEIETKIQQTEEQIAQGAIKAQCDGTVCVVQTLVTGNVISSGTVIATILPKNENVYKVQLYVNNADIANVQVGDMVKFNIAALPSNQYGTVNGTINKVSTDTVVQEGQYSGYYLIECTIENDTLYDKDGNTGTISVGMQLEAKIITQEKTILRYLLEKINIF